MVTFAVWCCYYTKQVCREGYHRTSIKVVTCFQMLAVVPSNDLSSHCLTLPYRNPNEVNMGMVVLDIT